MVRSKYCHFPRVLGADINPRAGAHWLPHSRAHEPVICDWDVQTYDYWLEMIRQEGEDRNLPPSGIKVCDS
jgi:hypothetical protein